jgi:hypothetical protein
MANKARMALDVYWKWERTWVKELQIHSQRVTIWQWLRIFDLMRSLHPSPMIARSDILDQDSSPYAIQDIDDSESPDANDTGSDVEVNLLRDL